MSDNTVWQQTSIVSPGGTVFSLAADSTGRLWLASGAGIFYQDQEIWSPLPRGQPLAQVSALACAGPVVLAGGSQGQVIYSTDGGETWYGGRTDQVSEPITCLAASPNFQQDGVVLAGTDGTGILRSTDGGRAWRLTNFGLQDFTVIALAMPPAWSRREVVFAATTHGLYRSPNGGRAWKKSDEGLAEEVVQSIAVSPDFDQDRLVLAGTERKGLFRSTNGGKTWHAWGQGLTPTETDLAPSPDEFPSINCLWLHPEFATTPMCLAGTGEGQIFYSADGGANWKQVASADASVLCLERAGQRLYAGLHHRGLLYSDDDGQTWAELPHLAARALTRLISGHGHHLFAFGPLEYVWHSTDGGETWTRLEELAGQQPLLALAASPQVERPVLLVGTVKGLMRSTDHGQTWQTVLPAEEVTTIHFSPQFAADGRAWAGTSTGRLLTSADDGLTWTTLQPPKPGLPLVTLATLPPNGSNILAAATFDPGKQQVILWRSTDGGSTWQRWLSASAEWAYVHLGLVGQEGERIIACIGRRCWGTTATGWERLLEIERSIIRLAQMTDPQGLLALTSGQVLYSTDGANWSAFDEGLAGQALVDLTLSPTSGPDQVAYVLSTGGRIWRRRLADNGE